MKINPCPCKGCEERVLGCHSRCPKYLEFHKKREKLYEVRKKEFYSLPYSKRSKFKGGVTDFERIK